jgi:hypothetical protein
MEIRNLEKVRGIIKDATELDISYAYDDLVFPDHTAFIIQFDDNAPNSFFCYFQKECEPKEREQLLNELTRAFEKEKCSLFPKGSFSLKQNGEEVDIIFS